ncbi:MAG: hypothetical protein PVG63_01650 [Anaerolineales bacterium]
MNEIAGVILFLTGEAVWYSAGILIPVDGGFKRFVADFLLFMNGFLEKSERVG